MDTPICDFVRGYAQSGALRLHMPGHKGGGLLGMEVYDITEIDGADSLYEAGGVILQSEENASALFGAKTVYSTEGSSQCIRAMLYLTCLYAERHGKRPLIAAGRNAHKTFLSAAALLDFDVMWLSPACPESYLSCRIDAEALEAALEHAEEKPAAVYVTSPDYLGNVLDLRGLAEVCHRHGILLLVDNAHGAYLKFLPESGHPIDLGADLCCDSAHKTLPALTGAAYLHISDHAPAVFSEQAKNAMAMFGSTSPSYLLLQSLDAVNKYLVDGYREKLCDFLSEVKQTKERLGNHGYSLLNSEPLKITVLAKPYGYSGSELSGLLLEQGVVCEFSDPDYVVMMLTPETGREGLERLEQAMFAIPARPSIQGNAPEFHMPQRAMTVRDAAFSSSETVNAADSLGRILAVSTVGCPPAVPIVVSGERIDEAALRCFAYYGITSCTVVKDLAGK